MQRDAVFSEETTSRELDDDERERERDRSLVKDSSDAGLEEGGALKAK
jgi:hypothetical protein